MAKTFAFVFPGQGSQAVGMLDAWGEHPVVAETLREATDALGEDVGAITPADYARDMNCRVFPDESMVYAWKGMDILRLKPEKQPDGTVRWRMFTGLEAGHC